MNVLLRGLALSAIIMTIGAGRASATSYTINDATDVISGGIGDFYLVSGNVEASSPGQVTDILKLNTSAQSTIEMGSDYITAGTLYTELAANFSSVTKLVFGFGLNQNGATSTDAVTITDLVITLEDANGGADHIFSLDTLLDDNELTVWNFNQGANTAEVRFGIDLGFDFLTAGYDADSMQKLTISSTITNANDGFEIYFFSTAFTGQGGGVTPAAVPEPATLALFGTGLAFIASQVRRRKPRK